MLYEEQMNHNENILIIDDVETNRLVLEEIIKNMGYCPILAESGEQALEMLKDCCPQLILTDISMPGMDGYELCKILKGKEETKNIPVVFISAYDNPEDIVEGFFIGGEDYITKPFISEVVKARVGVHLRLHEAKRDLMQTNRRLQISVTEQLKQMEQEKKNILYALANIAVQDSDNKKEHLRRLGHNCKILAQGMQLSPLFEGKVSDTFVDTIELAAPLCDIGNIGVPKELLQEGKVLSDKELEIVQGHTSIGAKILKDLNASNDYNDFISTSIDIVQHHHEKWDGSGYPSGLKGEEIPLAAQIVSVAELYGSMREESGRDREQTLESMREYAGVMLNPDIFEICCKISRQLS